MPLVIAKKRSYSIDYSFLLNLKAFINKSDQWIK